MAGKIFINYRRDESGHVAGRLHDSFAPTFGRNKLFMDVDSIPVGVDFEAYLNSQVAACDAVLVVIGPNWLDAKDKTGQRRLHQPDDFVAIEIAAALARNIPVVPVLVDGAHMPKTSELPDSLKPLARRQAIQVRHTSFSSDAETLIKKMREALGYDSPGRQRRVQATKALAAVAVLLLIGWAGYVFIFPSKQKIAIEEAFREAIGLDPKNAEFFCTRGRAKLEIKDASGNADIAKAREIDASSCL
jgi:TIR domain